MVSQNLIRWLNYATIASGVLVALYFGLHPGAPSAASARNSFYATIGTLGVSSFGLMLAGLFGIVIQLGKRLGRLGTAGVVVAFLAAYLVGCGVFVDAYVAPILADQAPAFFKPTVTPTTLPLVLMLVVPAFAFSVGFIVLSVAALRAQAIPRWAGWSIIVGAVMLDLPPEPAGPTPWAVIAVGSVAFGAGLVGFGVTLLQVSRSLPQDTPALPSTRDEASRGSSY
jgi:hypothetical protein